MGRGSFAGWLALSMNVLLTMLVTSASASAQSITLSPVIGRRDGRPSELPSNVINRDDCMADPDGDSLSLELLATDLSGSSLEVWAGILSDCGDPARSPTLVPTRCWQLAATAPIPSAISLSVRDILPHDPSGAGTGTPSVCETAGDTYRNGIVSVFFVPMRGPFLAAGPAATLELKFDLRAPEAPTAQTLTAGNGTLTLAWSTPKISDANDQRVYCEPVAPDGCAATHLVAGQRPPESLPFTAVTMESSAAVTGLMNQQRYACGVASRDYFGNLGPLSNLLCETPKPTSSSAGPEITGRCGFARSSSPSGATAIVMAALMLAYRRKRSERRPRA